MQTRYTVALVLGMIAWAIAPGRSSADIKSLKIDGTKIIVNGKPVRLWGVRVAGAAGRDQYTAELLESIEYYRGRGINALVVSYQGSSGQTWRAFSPDGRSFADVGIRDRMRRIIQAAGAADMVVIVGLFFPRKMGVDGEDPRLESREAYINAARTAAEELKTFNNVIISVAHDAGRAAWSTSPFRCAPEDAIECLRAIASVADMPRGCGGEEHAFNETVGASDAATVIIHHERTPGPPKFTAAKPAINVCMLGRESGGRGNPQGVWSAPERDRFFQVVEKYLASDRDHLCAHFQGWHEGGMDLRKNIFAVGGMGTLKDPGTAWFFEGLERRLRPPAVRHTGGPPTTGRTIFDF